MRITLCKLEQVFPPGFFDSMEHLSVHLAYEAMLGGPVQYRWMYPFERFMGDAKRCVKNKAKVEGSICTAYTFKEANHFMSHYFIKSTLTLTNTQNEVDATSGSHSFALSVFCLPGRHVGNKEYWMKDEDLGSSEVHVLINCTEVKPYLEYVHHVYVYFNPMFFFNITEVNF